ncbi:MAG: ECF-type riboflavin transporter substrate-binding protein [Lactobacillaceae bacterium]|nr:ECF-type riboflavin transporter substrate-binding protein [Lactobacillaceae bacterium]
MKHFVKAISIIFIGAIIFSLLASFLTLPTGVLHTEVSLSQPWLAFITALFGPIIGGAVAFFGHALTDYTTIQSFWWSWVIANALFGILLGLATQRIRLFDGVLTLRKLVLFNIWQLIANIIAWSIIAPLGDMMIYGENRDKVFQQGFIATGADFIAIAIFGSLAIWAYNRYWINRAK